MCLLPFPSREGQRRLVLENVSTEVNYLISPDFIHPVTYIQLLHLGAWVNLICLWKDGPQNHSCPQEINVRARASQPPQSRTAFEPLAQSLGEWAVGWGSELWFMLPFTNCGSQSFLWSQFTPARCNLSQVTFLSLALVTHARKNQAFPSGFHS